MPRCGTTRRGDYASGAGLGFYRSDDAGETWYSATTDPRPAMRIGGGDLSIASVDPKNPDVVYSTSIVTVRSTDGGKTWMSIRGAPGGDDYQNIWINPNDPQNYSAGQRSGRDRHRERRRNLEFLVQPADRAALSRGDRQTLSLSRLRRAAGERFGVHFKPRQRRRNHLSRLASRRRHRVRLRGARSAAIPMSFTAAAATKFPSSIGPPGKCRMLRPSLCAARNTAPIAPSR